MLSLLQILKESTSKPKCIFLAGAPGSGKSTILKQLNLFNFVTINIDDDYEKLIKSSGLSMDQSSQSPEGLSQMAKLMQQAKNLSGEKLIKSIKNKQDIIIDGTGASSNVMKKKKSEMEQLGYETFLLGLYVSPITSLERNMNRERILMPQIVLRTWMSYSQNIDLYREMFGSNFVLIDNEGPNPNKQYNPEDIAKKYFTKSMGKPKTPEEEQKSKLEKDEMNKSIQQLIKMERQFDSMDEAKQKINTFING